MTAYIVRRLLLMVPVLWGVGTFVFVLVRLLPGDAITTLLEDSQNVSDVQAMRRELGLDQPLPVQYVQWMGHAVRFDFGNSLLSRRPVLSELRRTVPVSAELAVLAVLVTVLVAVPGGTLAAAKQDSPWDYLARGFSVAFLATPSFWLATMALVLPAYWWGWVPPLQYRPLLEEPAQNLQQFLLPGLILGISSAAVSLRMMRSQMLEVLRQDYVRTAWAKGLARRRVLVRHALRNALIPVITLFGNEFGRLLGGTVIIETIFGLPGVGRLTADAIFKRDYPQVEANVLFFAVVFVTLNLVIDLCYSLIDPRVRYHS
jgi:peptide/nickel transport system permease protein